MAMMKKPVTKQSSKVEKVVSGVAKKVDDLADEVVDLAPECIDDLRNTFKDKSLLEQHYTEHSQ